MSAQELIKLNLNIGGQRFSLNVPFDRQEFARDVEESVDSLYKKWRRNFPQKTDGEVMAMVAYQFASHYKELTEKYEFATEKAEQCLRLLDPDA
jgi:cell division protein ZapA (FtsZ GTPase activity inhibitor)